MKISLIISIAMFLSSTAFSITKPQKQDIQIISSSYITTDAASRAYNDIKLRKFYSFLVE